MKMQEQAGNKLILWAFVTIMYAEKYSNMQRDRMLSERHYISIYNFIYPFVLWLPTGALWNRDLFPFMLQCCLQTAVELHFTSGNLQKAWRFKVCMGLSEFLRSANLMVSACSVVLEAFPGEIPDGNRDIIWLQRAQAKICIQAPDRFKRGLKTQRMLAEHAQILLCIPDMHRFYGSSWGPHRKKTKSIPIHQKKRHFVGLVFFIILIHSTVQQFP